MDIIAGNKYWIIDGLNKDKSRLLRVVCTAIEPEPRLTINGEKTWIARIDGEITDILVELSGFLSEYKPNEDQIKLF